MIFNQIKAWLRLALPVLPVWLLLLLFQKQQTATIKYIDSGLTIKNIYLFCNERCGPFSPLQLHRKQIRSYFNFFPQPRFKLLEFNLEGFPDLPHLGIRAHAVPPHAVEKILAALFAGDKSNR